MMPAILTYFMCVQKKVEGAFHEGADALSSTSRDAQKAAGDLGQDISSAAGDAKRAIENNAQEVRNCEAHSQPFMRPLRVHVSVQLRCSKLQTCHLCLHGCAAVKCTTGSGHAHANCKGSKANLCCHVSSFAHMTVD
jgi:hypothetical protein